MPPKQKITVTKQVENQLMVFLVIIEKDDRKTQHKVSLNRVEFQKITRGQINPESLIKLAFEFLLERESQEKILPEFNFINIERYFPTFKKDIQKKINKYYISREV